MELSNEFRVSVGPKDAWKVLTDVERIAPHMPGAQLQEVDGEDYKGIVKVKVGPITAQYKGTARFIEKDQEKGRLVLEAKGRDTRGQGNANATVTATLQPDGDGTRVKVATDLTITGKVAQFGRGVLAEVSGKLINQFVDGLEGDLQGSPDRPDSSAPPRATDERIQSVEPDPVDLVQAAGGSVAKRVAPAMVVGLLVLWVLRRKRRT